MSWDGKAHKKNHPHSTLLTINQELDFLEYMLNVGRKNLK